MGGGASMEGGAGVVVEGGVLGKLFDPCVVSDAFYRCTLCGAEFFSVGSANHFKSCSDYIPTDRSTSRGRLGGVDNCILVFGPADLHAEDGGAWARARANPGTVTK
jgi:hypothetical protein